MYNETIELSPTSQLGSIVAVNHKYIVALVKDTYLSMKGLVLYIYNIANETSDIVEISVPPNFENSGHSVFYKNIEYSADIRDNILNGDIN